MGSIAPDDGHTVVCSEFLGVKTDGSILHSSADTKQWEPTKSHKVAEAESASSISISPARKGSYLEGGRSLIPTSLSCAVNEPVLRQGLLGMAYYAASTPPPPRAPSLAPTTASEMTMAPMSPPIEKKKVKDLLKRALKEVSGGGGNNAKFEEALKARGEPVLRPYGRGGVGTKSKVDVDVNALQKTSSKSTDGSPSNQYPSGSQNVPPDHPRARGEPEFDQEYFHPEASEYYVGGDGESESVISSIPAPRRTQQWINHLASLPSPPNSHAGTPPAPSPYQSLGQSPQQHRHNIFPNSPPQQYYQPSQYSRTSSDPQYEANQAAAYRYQRDGHQGGASGHPASFRARGLESVDEHGAESGGQISPGFEEQFGRFGVSDSDWGSRRPPASSSSMSSPRARPSPSGNALSGRSPANQYASRFMGNHPAGQASDDPYAETQPSRPSPPPLTSSSPFSQPEELATQNPQRYHATHVQHTPRSIADQYIALARSSGQTTPLSLSPSNQPVAVQVQARELQSQIEKLREQERQARERLEAFRRDNEARIGASGSPSGGAQRKVSASSSEMSGQRGGMASGTTPEAQRQHVLPVMAANIGAEQRTLAPDPRRRALSDVSALTTTTSSASGAVISAATVVPSHAQLDVMERERLQRHGVEREQRDARQATETEFALASTPADPQRPELLQQRSLQNMRSESSSPQNTSSAMVAGSHLAVSTQPTVAYPGLDTQQQLIMQLGALLLQQQQQLQILTAVHTSRVAPPLIPPSSNLATGEQLALQPGVGLPALGGLDLNALLALAALQQQQQQMAQTQVLSQGQAQPPENPASRETPTLITSPPSNNDSDSHFTREESPVPSSYLSPGSEPSDSMSRESSSNSRREREAPVPASSDDEKYLEALGMNASDAMHLGSATAYSGRTRRAGPPRTGPPRAPLPAVPNMPENHSSQPVAVPASNASGSRQGTPPPSYNRATR
ncbi:hypothetical protein FRB98_006365 [Tulasnella sp. 332]|nr:hypothetical protein FRB98_006365 [Tulasnella sp. 332]